jgi:hypothetical protein
LPYDDVAQLRAANLLLAADYSAADKLLSRQLGHGTIYQQAEVYWTLAVSLREQGRLSAALDAARHSRVDRSADGHVGTNRTEAQIFSNQRVAEGRALFDSLALAHNGGDTPSQIAEPRRGCGHRLPGRARLATPGRSGDWPTRPGVERESGYGATGAYIIM